MNKFYFFSFFILLSFFLISLVASAQYDDCSIYGTCKSSNGNKYYNNTYQNITYINMTNMSDQWTNTTSNVTFNIVNASNSFVTGKNLINQPYLSVGAGANPNIGEINNSLSTTYTYGDLWGASTSDYLMTNLSYSNLYNVSLNGGLPTIIARLYYDGLVFQYRDSSRILDQYWWLQPNGNDLQNLTLHATVMEIYTGLTPYFIVQEDTIFNDNVSFNSGISLNGTLIDDWSDVNYTGSSTWVDTATSDLNMSEYNITNVTAITNTNGDDAILLHDSGAISFPRQSYIGVHKSTATSVATSSDTLIIFNQEDTDNIGDYNTTTGLFTVPETGAYHISAYLTYESTTGTSQVRIYKNGAFWTSTVDTLDNSLYNQMDIDVLMDLAQGDTIGIYARQTSGGTKTIIAGRSFNYLSISKVA